MELPTCAEDDISGTHMITFYLSKAAAMKTGEFVRFHAIMERVVKPKIG